MTENNKLITLQLVVSHFRFTESTASVS